MSYPLRYKKETSGWDTETIEAFDGGLNSSKRPESIANNDLLEATNVVLTKGLVQGDTGYKAFGQPVLGTPQASVQYFQRDGGSELILITTQAVYSYSETASEWQFVAGFYKTTTSAPAGAGATSISVNAFTMGQPPASMHLSPLGIMLTDGSQHKAIYGGMPNANLLIISPAIPAGKSVAMGAPMVFPPGLAGSLDKTVSITQVASHDWLVFTNGVDSVRYYNGLQVLPVPNIPTVNTCVCVAQYNSALFLLGTTENGLSLPQRIRRSALGDPTNWTTLFAGFDDLYNSADFILAAEILGPYLIVYRERSIVRGQYVNTAGRTYSWDPMVEGEGVVSTAAVVNLNAEHLIFANAGIYSYSGGYDLKSVGDKVFHQIFSTDGGELNSSMKHKTFSFYVEELDEAWFVYAAGSSTEPNVLMRYNVGDENWARRELSTPMVGYGFYQTVTSKSWLNLVGSWSQQTWAWNARLVSGESPTTQLCGSNGQVYEYDYVTVTDAGSAIPVSVETKDFFMSQFSMRFDTMQAYLKGQSVSVQMSFDSGVSYQDLGIVSSSVMTPVSLSRQEVADKVRFRFSSSEPGFALGWLAFDYRLESSYRRV